MGGQISLGRTEKEPGSTLDHWFFLLWGQHNLSLCFFEEGVNPASRAVLAQMQPVRIVFFVFCRRVEEAAFQLATRHLDDDSVALFHYFFCQGLS
jgi:hypothetical protein